MTVQLRQRLLGFLGLSPGHPYVVRAHHLRRDLLRSDQRLRDDYLQSAAVPRLHVGGGWHRLEGWLNTDIDLIPEVMRMDATQPFPFDDQTFDYVFTEHMIEHISYEAGAFMLRECHRVLKPGGVIRVTTPDLSAITRLHNGELSADQEQYLAWFCRTFVAEGYPHNPAAAINAMFRQWGHQFIYDEKTLSDSMARAGFSSMTRLPVGESKHPELLNLEHQQRYPEGLLNYESVALEAIK